MSIDLIGALESHGDGMFVGLVSRPLDGFEWSPDPTPFLPRHFRPDTPSPGPWLKPRNGRVRWYDVLRESKLLDDVERAARELTPTRLLKLANRSGFLFDPRGKVGSVPFEQPPLEVDSYQVWASTITEVATLRWLTRAVQV